MAGGLVLAIACAMPQARAFEPDGCEQQRAQYPKNWNDASKEKTVFSCMSHYAGPLQITLGAHDGKGRTLMSVVPKQYESADNEAKGIYRIWLDRKQTRRLQQGKYFATIVRTEMSCWIRGNLEGSMVFFMDNVNPPADNPDEAGSFYNKAPRFSVFGKDSYSCEPAK